MAQRHIAAHTASPERACAAMAAAQHGVITRAQALSVGLSRRAVEWRLTSGRWRPVYPGIYVLAGTPASWHQNVLCACLSAGPGAGASHRCAAALLGLDGFEPGVIEISTPRHLEPTGVVVHRTRALRPQDIKRVNGIPATTINRTLLDLGAVCAPESVEAALDDALRRRLTTIENLSAYADSYSGRGRRGAATLRRLLDARRDAPPMESQLEARLWKLIVRSSLPSPARQYEVRAGRFIGRVDFAYPEQRLAIEADGYRWHSGRAAWQRDLARRNALSALGWKMLHVTWNDVTKRPAETVEAIRTAYFGGETTQSVAGATKNAFRRSGGSG